MRPPLDDREREVLDAIVGLVSEFEWPPTIKEILARTGLKSKMSVHEYLKRLADKGYIRRGPGARQIVVLHLEEAR